MSPVIILVGIPGAGKSSVGRSLAHRLGVAFRDTDMDIERAERRKITEIFVDEGEAGFRELEKVAVARGIAEHHGVLALGGGAVIAPETRELLKGLPVVWLQVRVDEAASRVGLNVPRPVLLGNVRGQLKVLSADRRAWYEEVAQLTVDTDHKTVAQVAGEIMSSLGYTQGEPE